MKKKNKARRKKSAVNLVQAELAYLISFLGSISDTSEFLDVRKPTVTKWLKGATAPDLENETKIAGLCYVIFRLSNIYVPEVVLSWLKGSHPTLNHRRPIDLLKRGRFTEVFSDIEQAAAGSYA
jgi:transcriptional regulator with XRE-family HTH domain